MTVFILAIVIIALGGFAATLFSTAKETSKNVRATTQQVLEMNSRNELKEELKELKKLIKIKHQELENLVNATEQAKRRTVNNLTVEQEDAIDLYERNGIRLPIDIIEELSYSNNVTYHSAVAFIEMQRKVWKAQFQVTMTKGMIG